jgi:hypothetical protein
VVECRHAVRPGVVNRLVITAAHCLTVPLDLGTHRPPNHPAYRPRMLGAMTRKPRMPSRSARWAMGAQRRQSASLSIRFPTQPCSALRMIRHSVRRSTLIMRWSEA